MRRQPTGCAWMRLTRSLLTHSCVNNKRSEFVCCVWIFPQVHVKNFDLFDTHIELVCSEHTGRSVTLIIIFFYSFLYMVSVLCKTLYSRWWGCERKKSNLQKWSQKCAPLTRSIDWIYILQFVLYTNDGGNIINIQHILPVSWNNSHLFVQMNSPHTLYRAIRCFWLPWLSLSYSFQPWTQWWQ